MLNIEKLKQHKILASGVHYSVASTFTSIIGMVVSILCMRYIGPEEMGIWQSVCIVAPYFTFLQLGIQSGLNIELPILMGANNENKIKIYISTALSCSIIVTAFILLLSILCLVALTHQGSTPQLIIAALGMFVIAINESITIHLVAKYRSSGSFNILAIIHWIQAIVMLLCVICVLRYGLYGFISYTIIHTTIKTILMVLYSPFKDVRPSFNREAFVHLLKIGVIMMGFGQIRSFAQSLPKWLLLYVGGSLCVGLFSPALAVGAVMNILPNQIVQFFQPQMGYKYGEDGKAANLWKYTRFSIVYLPLVALPIAIVLYLIEPWMITVLFPKYLQSIVPIQIITIGFVFSTSFISHSVLYTIKAYKEAMLYSAVEFLGYLLIPAMFYYLFGINILNSVALGISCTYCILYILNYFLVKGALLSPTYNQ